MSARIQLLKLHTEAKNINKKRSFTIYEHNISLYEVVQLENLMRVGSLLLVVFLLLGIFSTFFLFH